MLNDKTCNDCQHYLQHYILIDGKIRPVYCGHCLMHSKRRIRPDCKSCEAFALGVPISEQLVNKQYLTKTLLQHLLSLELWTATK